MIRILMLQRLTASIWTRPNLKPGDVVWVPAAGARYLIEAGLADLAPCPRAWVALQPVGELKALIARCERREITQDQLRGDAEALLERLAPAHGWRVTVRSRAPGEPQVRAA